MTTTIPKVRIVASGPIGHRNQARQALTSAGFVVSPTEDTWGLPSWPDPITAHGQGAPNAGHTPGTPHPDTMHRRTTEDDQAAADAAHQAAHQAAVDEARAAHEETVAAMWEQHIAEVAATATADYVAPPAPPFVEPPDPGAAPMLPEFVPEAHECDHVGADYEADPTVAFMTADGPDPDKAVAALVPLGWMLRMTVVPVGEVTSTEDLTFGVDRVGDLEQQVAELKRMIEGGQR